MNYIRLYSIIIIFASQACKQMETPVKKTNPSKFGSQKQVRFKQVDLNYDTSGFLINCEKNMSGSSVGSLQGSEHSIDSTGYLCFIDNYDNNSFEIIFSLKGGIDKRKNLGYIKLGEIFDSSCSNKFNDFECFAFVLPMRDPQKQEDISKMNIDFPVIVKSYKRIVLDNWKFLKEVNIKSFKDFVALQFNTVYGLN